MCFSATASFTASAILFSVGAYTIKKVKSNDQLCFASTPLVFGAQQLSEGILWLCLPEPERLMCTQVSKYTFVSIGQILWPVWVPLSIYLLEKDNYRKNILKIVLGLGSLMAILLVYLTVTNAIEAKIFSNQIQYNFMYPEYISVYSLLYLIPTTLSYFLSSMRFVKYFGLILLSLFLATKYFYSQLVFSTWCFFSAVASIYIYVVIDFINNEDTLLNSLRRFWPYVTSFNHTKSKG